jgi:hypothetical protein
VPPFYILDSEISRKDVSLSNDVREQSSSNSISKRSKVFDKASTDKLHSAPIITTDTLRVNKSLLIGKKLKKYFKGFGGALGTVIDYLLDHDTYRLEYSNGHVDIISFNDFLKLLPKSWSNPRDSSNEEVLLMQGEPALEEALFVHVEAVALIAHITTDRAPPNATQFTTPKDSAHAIDPERTPDFRIWLEATRKEYDLLDKTMRCWEVVDIDILPEDANLIGVKWVFKIKYKNGEYEHHNARIVALGYQQRKDVDLFASFSPTASYFTIRLVLALTTLPHWYGVDLDATGAFISAPLPPEEQVYLEGIPGYDLPKSKCLRLKKTIYGLVQALHGPGAGERARAQTGIGGTSRDETTEEEMLERHRDRYEDSRGTARCRGRAWDRERPADRKPEQAPCSHGSESIFTHGDQAPGLGGQRIQVLICIQSSY